MNKKVTSATWTLCVSSNVAVRGLADDGNTPQCDGTFSDLSLHAALRIMSRIADTAPRSAVIGYALSDGTQVVTRSSVKGRVF